MCNNNVYRHQLDTEEGVLQTCRSFLQTCRSSVSYITAPTWRIAAKRHRSSVMPPNIRLKGPLMSSSRVSIHTEYHIRNKKRVKKLTESIKLGPEKLRQALDMNISDSDSDLWSLDQELNKNLLELTQALSQGPKTAEKNDQNPPKNESLDLYRTIPPNLRTTIDRELGEDLGMIEKMIFTLKDPITATRIRLPVRSTSCAHFECFDFDNFCEFTKIPAGVKAFIRKDLVKRGLELKRYEKLIQKDAGRRKVPPPPQWLQPIHHAYLPNIPTYKCPVCDTAFPLHQLYISDVFNFFVKFTPSYVHRIEITDRIKYRIIEDEKEPSTSAACEDIVVLSDDDDEAEVKTEPITSNSTHSNHSNHSTSLPFSDDVFDDGLDEQLALLPQEQGSGTWNDPVTVD